MEETARRFCACGWRCGPYLGPHAASIAQRAYEAHSLTCWEPMKLMRTVHYVGFTDDRYWSAFRIFGGPRMIHRRWDRRAQRDVGPQDVVIFAHGDETQPLSRWNGDDLDERLL